MVVNLSNTSTTYLERTEGLTRFYEDIRKFSILSQEEQNKLFDVLKSETASKKEKELAKETLINTNQRFVVAVAKRYGTDDNILDLIEEGNIGLIEAIDTFDNSKGTKFMTWAVWYIRRAINFYLINYGKIVLKTNSHKTYHLVTKATNKFIQDNERQPTTEELADVLENEYGIRINNINDLTDTQIASIDEKIDEESKSGDFNDMMDYNNKSQSLNSHEGEINKEFNTKVVASLLQNLTDRDREIITLLFGIGYDREYEVQEVADRVGLTPERVRQLKVTIIEELKANYISLLEKI